MPRTGAPPCCSRPISWPTSIRSPITWRSSTAAGWWWPPGSTLFANVWAPAVLALCVGPVAGAVDQIVGGPTAFSLLAMMHGEPYFRGSGLPWPMLLASAALSAALIYAGVRIIARRDF